VDTIKFHGSKIIAQFIGCLEFDSQKEEGFIFSPTCPDWLWASFSL
jgi:hypothetical protein